MITCEYCNDPVSGEAIITDGLIVHQHCWSGYRRKLAGLVHECPKCKTSGKVNHPDKKTVSLWVPIKQGETADCAYNDCRGCPHCGEKETFVVIRIPCDLCDGKGYLKEEPRPVTRVVDWEMP